MSDISNIHNVGGAYSFLRPVTPDATGQQNRITESSQAALDTVEISPRASALARAAEASSLRIARTNAIRAQIASGTFETPERIEGTITKLLDVIG